MARLKLATVWLAGCSGCHMSFLDLDEWLIGLAGQVDFVYTPLADLKEYPEGVDVVLVEGAVANEENLHFIRLVRQRTKLLISFGDCAVTGNVTALRNLAGGPSEAQDVPLSIRESADVKRRGDALPRDGRHRTRRRRTTGGRRRQRLHGLRPPDVGGDD